MKRLPLAVAAVVVASIFLMLATSTTSALSPAEGCTYADADKNNGWGWNPFTRKSCKPTANICDYVDAPRHKKWGWNATTETSCEPLADNSDADNSDAAATKKTRESLVVAPTTVLSPPVLPKATAEPARTTLPPPPVLPKPTTEPPPSTTTTVPSTTTTVRPTTTTSGPDGDVLGPEEHLALLQSNPSRNKQFDNNRFKDVPMDEISMDDLTGEGDLYPDGFRVPDREGGYFRVQCELSHFAYDDPIVAPNQPGGTHLHMFFGNTESNAYSTFDSLRNSGTGTCNGEDLNRSSYWVPALLDRDGNALVPWEIMVYYKNETAFYQGRNEQNEVYPDGLRMVVGNAMATSPQETLSDGPGTARIVGFACGVAYQVKDVSALIPDCYGTGIGPGGPNGTALEMRVLFPQCHNPEAGTYLADQSHMSYSDGGFYAPTCPASHPTAVSSITYRIFYAPDHFGGALTDLHLSSDVRPDGTILPGGTTAHGDWFGAWHPETMKTWIDNCNNKPVDCETGMVRQDPDVSLIPRKRGFYPDGYKAAASDLLTLCPGRQFDSARALESVANCQKGRMAPK